jgi:monoamine oxidase
MNWASWATACRFWKRAFAGGRCQTARKGFSLTELGGDPQTLRVRRRPLHQPRPVAHPAAPSVHAALHALFEMPLEVMVNDNDHSIVYLENAGPLSPAAPAPGPGQGRHARPRGRAAGQVGARTTRWTSS